MQANGDLGTLSVSLGLPLVLDSASLQLCLSPCLYSFASLVLPGIIGRVLTQSRRFENQWPILFRYPSERSPLPLGPMV